jgi:hypothetical protein
VIVTCGDWDIRTCLRKEANYKKIELPMYLKRWINLKKVFSAEGETPTIENIAKARAVVTGMEKMLQLIGLPLVGK